MRWQAFSIYSSKSRQSYHGTVFLSIELQYSKVIFTSAWKVIYSCFCFAAFRPVIVQENSRLSLNQLDARLESIATCSLLFSRALGSLLVFNLNSH